MEPSQVSVIVPAAGSSSRFGADDKLAMPWGDSTVLGTVLARAAALGALEVVLVGREAAGCISVENPDPERGMASSIACGVRAASSRSAGFLIWPADMPLIPVAAAQAVVQAGDSVVPARTRHDETPGHPVFFGASLRAELSALHSGPGARGLLDALRGLTWVEWPDASVLEDIDTPAAYRRLLGRA